MIDLRGLKVAMGRMQRVGPLAKLLPLVVGSVLVTLLATAASPEPTGLFFQSPVSPISPVTPTSTIGTTPEGPPATPEETVTGPALVAVPAARNLVPWLAGIILVAAIVGVTMLYRRHRRKGEDRA